MTKKTLVLVGLAIAALAFVCAFAGEEERVFFFSAGGSWLGVNIADVDSARAKELGLKEERGAEVQSVVPDGPAAAAGIKEGDVILEYQGTKVEGVAQLTRLVRETPPGRTANVTLWRDRSSKTLQVKVAEREHGDFKDLEELKELGKHHREMRRIQIPPVDIPPIDIPEIHGLEMMRFGGPGSGRLGASVEDLTEQLGEHFGVKDGQGVLVRSVRKGSPGETAGLRAGDVIVKVGDTKIEDTSDLRLAIREQRGKKDVALTVVRDKREQTLTVALPEEGPARDKDRVQMQQEREEARRYAEEGRRMGDEARQAAEEYRRALEEAGVAPRTPRTPRPPRPPQAPVPPQESEESI